MPRRQTLSHWQKDIDLAGIRNAAALAKLPAGEQKAFTFDENVLACHACHYGTVVRLPVVDQYLARVGPTHRSIEHAIGRVGRCDRRAQRHLPAAGRCPFLDTKVMAIQFSEDWRPTRDSLTNEKDTLEIEGFRYEPMRRQWERRDHEQPAVLPGLHVRTGMG